jgi:hypothetical protein
MHKKSSLTCLVILLSSFATSACHPVPDTGYYRGNLTTEGHAHAMPTRGTSTVTTTETPECPCGHPSPTHTVPAPANTSASTHNIVATGLIAVVFCAVKYLYYDKKGQ